MNVVKEIDRINQKQLGLSHDASWHDQYKDSAYIFVGGLDFDLTEGDVITIFSQFGEVADVNMPRNKSDNKPRGFAFLMYEDQRSTVLAVDNLNGAKVLERTLRVDHVNKFKQMEEGQDGKMKERETQSLNALPENFINNGEASDSGQSSHPSIDMDDPMAGYLLEQAKSKKRKKKSKHADETKEERAERKNKKKEKKRLKELEAKISAAAAQRTNAAGTATTSRRADSPASDRPSGRTTESRHRSRSASPPPRSDRRHRDSRSRSRSRSPAPRSSKRRYSSEEDQRDYNGSRRRPSPDDRYRTRQQDNRYSSKDDYRR